MWLVPQYRRWFGHKNVCTLEIPNGLLLTARDEGKCLIEQVNRHIMGNAVTLDVSCERVRTRLVRSAGQLASQFRMAKGSTKRSRIRDGVTCIAIHAGKTCNAADLAEKLELAEVH